MVFGLAKGEFAKRHKVTAGQVSYWLKLGLPLIEGARIDPEVGDAWVAANLDHDIRAAVKPSLAGPGESRLSALRGRKLEVQAAILDMARSQKAGELLERRLVEAAVLERGVFERDAWIGWTARTATVLAGEVGADPARMFAALDKAVRDHLAELSETALPGLDRGA